MDSTTVQNVATLATNHALQDLKILLKSLMLWSNPPTVYVYADSAIKEYLRGVDYRGTILVNETLNKYSGKTRVQMERIPGSILGKSLWFEFQMEKLALLEWVFVSDVSVTKTGVFYLDSDICLFKALPIVSASYEVALSRHLIKDRDEALYGKYNAGYLWIRTTEAIAAWRRACDLSRFFEQAALEVFDSEEWSPKTYMFLEQENYGWWRMFQGETVSAVLQQKWQIFRDPRHSGILVSNAPLGSVHTHWISDDPTTLKFNNFVISMLTKIAPSHPPAKKLLNIISRH